MDKDNRDLPMAILAAGGILRGEGPNARKIAVVRRRRYGGETGLPKGKLENFDDFISAATREVQEETGFEADIIEYAGTTHYYVGGLPKAVCYLVMQACSATPTRPIDRQEIEAIEWMTPYQAITALTHREDRWLVAAVFGLQRG